MSKRAWIVILASLVLGLVLGSAEAWIDYARSPDAPLWMKQNWPVRHHYCVSKGACDEALPL